MATEVLRDKLGNRVGEVETRPAGVQILRDKLGTRLGEYNPKDNTTRDKLGSRIGNREFIGHTSSTVNAKSCWKIPLRLCPG